MTIDTMLTLTLDFSLWKISLHLLCSSILYWIKRIWAYNSKTSRNTTISIKLLSYLIISCNQPSLYFGYKSQGTQVHMLIFSTMESKDLGQIMSSKKKRKNILKTESCHLGKACN